MRFEQVTLAIMGTALAVPAISAPFAIIDSYKNYLIENGTEPEAAHLIASINGGIVGLIVAAALWALLFPARRAASEILLSR